MSGELVELCKKAIIDEDAKELERLIEICDNLHREIETDGYTIDDIPPDELYMGMEFKLKELISRGVTRAIKPIEVHETKNLGEMWMGTDAIIKSPMINDAVIGKKVIVAPKYDGCSCAVKLERGEKGFYVKLARTRGRDEGTTKKYTELTKEMSELLEDSDWFGGIDNCVCLEGIKNLTVRGEIVVIDKSKLKQPPAPYVAGRINSNLKQLNKDGIVGYRMFEIMKLERENGEVYIPNQLETMEILSEIDQALVYSVIVLDGNRKKAEKQLMDIYEEWKENLDEPIDGIVYTEPTWRYPTQKEELGVNYGKYAMKPNVHSASRLTGISYVIQKDGKLIPSINFKQIVIEGRKISSARSSISDIYEFTANKHIHMNAIVEVMLSASISPVVKEARDDEDSINNETVELPRECPFCGGKLKLSKKTTSGKTVVTLACVNDSCFGVVIRKLERFFEYIGIKGIAYATIEKLYVVPDGVTDNLENRLRNLISEVGKRSNVGNAVKSATISNFVQAIDLLTKTGIEKDQELKPIRMNIVSSSIRQLINILGARDLSNYARTLMKIVLLE